VFVYLIINDVNGKIYIGKTIGSSLSRYLKQKIYDVKKGWNGISYLYNAMKHHGVEHFQIFPLISTLTTNEDLCFYERVLIAQYDSQSPDVGYNICRGGEGFTGHHSENTNKKISEASKRMWKRPEIRENFHLKMKGCKPNLTPEGREAIRRAHLGVKRRPETLQKLQKSHTGIRRSEASKTKQKQSVTGVKNHFYGKTHLENSLLKMKEKRSTSQYHSFCAIHGRLPVPSPRSRCPACKETFQPLVVARGRKPGMPFSETHCANLSIANIASWTPERRLAQAARMRQQRAMGVL